MAKDLNISDFMSYIMARVTICSSKYLVNFQTLYDNFSKKTNAVLLTKELPCSSYI